jgi:hypothetical protein
VQLAEPSNVTWQVHGDARVPDAAMAGLRHGRGRSDEHQHDYYRQRCLHGAPSSGLHAFDHSASTGTIAPITSAGESTTQPSMERQA